MFDVLKSLYITGSGPLWRKAKPLAAASAILILFDHGRGIVPSKKHLNTIRNFAMNKHSITTFYTIQSCNYVNNLCTYLTISVYYYSKCSNSTINHPFFMGKGYVLELFSHSYKHFDSKPLCLKVIYKYFSKKSKALISVF